MLKFDCATRSHHNRCCIFFFSSTQQPSLHMIDDNHLQPTAIISECTCWALYTPSQVFRYIQQHWATGDNNCSTYRNWYVWIVCFPWNIPHLAICLASMWVMPIVWYPVCHWKYQLLDVFQVHVGWMPFLNAGVETHIAVILGWLTVRFSTLHPQLTEWIPHPWSQCESTVCKVHGPDGKQKIKEALQVFDRDNNGFISTVELRHVMTNLGERMTEQEADEQGGRCRWGWADWLCRYVLFLCRVCWSCCSINCLTEFVRVNHQRSM